MTHRQRELLVRELSQHKADMLQSAASLVGSGYVREYYEQIAAEFEPYFASGFEAGLRAAKAKKPPTPKRRGQ